MSEKKTLTKFILEKLEESGTIMLGAILPRNRAESRVWRQILGLPTSYEFSKETFSALLHRLKKEGLVTKSGRGIKSEWLLTRIGTNKLKYYQNSIQPTKPDGIPRLVMYDIPESDRKKRNWIRSELVASDYEQLQKSVWLGYAPLPENFAKSLKDFRLEDKVHIVSINKKGTLHQI